MVAAGFQGRHAVRRLISSGSAFEAQGSYSRALVDGDWIFVAGTTGFDYATGAIDPDPATQLRKAFENVDAALREAGSSLADAVRITYYWTDAAYWEPCTPVMRAFLGEARPPSTDIVCGLVDPRMKVEIEVTARRRR